MLRIWGVGLCGVLVCSVVLSAGCGGEKRASREGRAAVTAEDLLAYNVQKAEQQAALLDSLAPDSLGYRDEGGLRIKWGFGPQAPVHPDGTVVTWAGEIRLANGETRLAFTPENPLRIAIGFSDWPEAFHEIASKSSQGDSIDCWFPAARAWGLTGRPPAIPQDAVIHLEVFVLDVQFAAAA